MNRLYILQEEVIGSEAYLDCSLRVHHIRNVLKSVVGDLLKVVVIGSGIGEWRIKKIGVSSVVLEVGEIVNHLATAQEISLSVGLCRPPTAKKIIEHATSLGVTGFTFFETELSEKSYSTSKVYTSSEYLKLLYLGLAQSAIYYKLPTVRLVGRFGDIIQEGALNLLLSFDGGPLSKIDLSLKKYDKINLIVGPERGFTQSEEAKFLSGSSPILITRSTLRTEIAIFASLAQLQMIQLT